MWREHLEIMIYAIKISEVLGFNAKMRRFDNSVCFIPTHHPSIMR